MHIRNAAFALALVGCAALTVPALAVDLPPICTSGAMGSHDMGATHSTEMQMPAGDMPDQAHQDLMAGMDQMNQQMMAGGKAVDIDVAFVCAMIPHHQGAIDMAKAELAHGDDPWAKEMAQKVITAQEAEIKDMLDWLGKQPQ